MKKSDAGNLCSHVGDALAYLYDEMGAADREKFEIHLADCTVCIDDFAELSQSRFPVFEWKQIEFDPLPAPRVVIPFETVSVAWFDKLRAAITMRPAFAFGSLATIAVAVSLTMFVLLNGAGGNTEFAEAIPTPAPTVPSPEASVEISDPTIDPVAAVGPKPAVKRGETQKPVKGSASAPKPTDRSTRPRATQQAKRDEPLPALSPVDEDEDDSLRLADIFEEIGTSES